MPNTSNGDVLRAPAPAPPARGRRRREHGGRNEKIHIREYRFDFAPQPLHFVSGANIVDRFEVRAALKRRARAGLIFSGRFGDPLGVINVGFGRPQRSWITARRKLDVLRARRHLSRHIKRCIHRLGHLWIEIFEKPMRGMTSRSFAVGVLSERT